MPKETNLERSINEIDGIVNLLGEFKHSQRLYSELYDEMNLAFDQMDNKKRIGRHVQGELGDKYAIAFHAGFRMNKWSLKPMELLEKGGESYLFFEKKFFIKDNIQVQVVDYNILTKRTRIVEAINLQYD